MKAIEAIKTGWNLHAVLRGNWEACADLLEIRRLNERATAAWTRGNNSGDQAYMKSMNAAADRHEVKAYTIAKRRGWKITQPGLWWEIRDRNGNDITIRM
jgi:hypothetical protein